MDSTTEGLSQDSTQEAFTLGDAQTRTDATRTVPSENSASHDQKEETSHPAAAVSTSVEDPASKLPALDDPALNPAPPADLHVEPSSSEAADAVVESMASTGNEEASNVHETTANSISSAAAAAVAAAEVAAGGVGILSEEQTNAALAALQEASDMVMKGPSDDANKKRPVDDDDDDNNNTSSNNSQPPTKQRRSTPMRVAWEDRIQMLMDYKEKHGDLLIPIRYKQCPSLGKFVHNTREQYKLYHHKTKAGYKKKCSLTAERIQQLNDIGFVWSTQRTKKQSEDWEARFEQLKQYKEKHGDCLVPHGYPEDPSFAEWIHRQRTTSAGKEKQNEMIAARMEKLRELGFIFTVHSDKWMDHWKELKEYKEKNGHCQVPTHYAENPKLGRWVHTQRHQQRLSLKGKKSCMTKERIDLLNDLGFSWEVRPSLEHPRATWQQRFDELKQFCTMHKHFRVPQDTHPQLHSWCHEQKQRLRNVDRTGKDVSRRMGPDRIESLAGLGFTKDVELAESVDVRVPTSEDTEKPSIEGETKEETTRLNFESVNVAI